MEKRSVNQASSGLNIVSLPFMGYEEI